MIKEQNISVELLQVALGLRKELTQAPSEREWDAVFAFSEKQAITGVMFAGVEHLPTHQRPEMGLLMDWLGQVEYLRTQSEQINKACVDVTRNFAKAGFDSVILKGQGLAKMYKQFDVTGFSSSSCISEDDRELIRTPGDIDCWVLADRNVICKYLQDNVLSYTGEHEGNLHTEFMYRDTTVEVHFTATYLTNPKYEKRLKQWIKEVSRCFNKYQRISEIEFPTPSLEFNLVYLQLHMYRHYLFEGIGLRHVIDYYIVLQKATEEQKREAKKTLKWLGADKFAGALMWVLGDTLKLSAETLICEPDAWRGRMLMDTIMKGGNFGKADKTNSAEYRRWGVKRLWRFVSRNISLFMAYPGEIGWHVLKRIVGENS